MSIFDTIARNTPNVPSAPAEQSSRIETSSLAAPQPQVFRAVVRQTSPRLSEDLIVKIEQVIRLGVTPWVAAAAAGVKSGTFYQWMHGRRLSQRAFQRRIKAAHAEARMNAEINACRTKPDTWLLKGPGRDRGDPLEPGWVSSPEVALQVNTAAPAVENAGYKVDLSRLTIEELRAYRALTAKTQPALPVNETIEGAIVE